jgi:MFS family permease
MRKWWPLVALAAAQFVMVLDQSVMNVSISTLVDDFDTTVTTIQAVITLYCLTMAMFMLTGGKIGDIIGRRKAFVVGLMIYACGSAITAVAPTGTPAPASGTRTTPPCPGVWPVTRVSMALRAAGSTLSRPGSTLTGDVTQPVRSTTTRVVVDEEMRMSPSSPSRTSIEKARTSPA